LRKCWIGNFFSFLVRDKFGFCKVNDCCVSTGNAAAGDLSILASESFIPSLTLTSISTSGLLTEVNASTTFAAIVASAIIFSACVTIGSFSNLIIAMALAFIPSLAINAVAVEATWVAIAVVDVNAVRWV
jgi:hypothetical protein